MNKIKTIFLWAILLGILGLVACSDNNNDDTTKKTGKLEIAITGLDSLGENYAYEGWIIVNKAPVSTGTFKVNKKGELSKTSFEMSYLNLKFATAYVLTIEPSPDSDPLPSSTHILAGDFPQNQNVASLSVAHSSALGNDFAELTGKYILATPTDGNNTMNEKHGVWWFDPTNRTPTLLNLPTLPSGWKYEGWAVINKTTFVGGEFLDDMPLPPPVTNTIPVTTGKFLSASGEDEAAPFSGPIKGPQYPGEDFLQGAPDGLNFPNDSDLAGGQESLPEMTPRIPVITPAGIVVSIEPDPDDSPAPFLLKPLIADVAHTAVNGRLYDMTNNASATNPTGTATRDF